MAMALRPQLDKPWGLGLHQCSRPRVWTPEEQRLFQEIGRRLADALSSLQTHRILQESEDRLRSTLDAAQIVTWEIIPRTGAHSETGPVDKLFGLPEGTKRRRVEDLLQSVHPQDRQRVAAELDAALRGQGDCSVEFRAALPEGAPPKWIAARGKLQHDSQGQPTRLLGIATDITERKLAEEKFKQLANSLEERVAERMNELQTASAELKGNQRALMNLVDDLNEKTTALETANKELESFSYSVSHDLRAPLRGIDGFSQLLLMECADKLDDKGKNFLRLVLGNVERMKQLIEDILKLSRVSRVKLQMQKVNLSELAREIAEDLARREPARKLALSIAPEVVVTGDAGFLRIALENLLGNAWKFTARRPQASIEFGVAQQKGQPAYFVRDNGAGFDMKDVSRLFGAFQRLHSATEFPGTGVGLATVERIIRRHGGRVWAEGAVNQGATFYFTLP